MGGLLRNLRQTTRSLVRTPLFTAITVAPLAVAIGANSAIFSVVNGVLLRPLPYPESDRLVVVGHTAPLAGFPEVPQATGTYVLYRDENTTLESLGMYREGSMNVSGEGEPQRLRSAWFTVPMFDVLRVRPFLGRSFRDEESLPDAERVTILAHGMWERRFGADPGVIDRTIVLDGESYRKPRPLSVPKRKKP